MHPIPNGKNCSVRNKWWKVCTSQSLVQIKLKTAFHSRGASIAVLTVRILCVPCRVCKWMCVSVSASVYVSVFMCIECCLVFGTARVPAGYYCWFYFSYFLGFGWLCRRRYWQWSVLQSFYAYGVLLLVPRTHFTLLLHTTTPSSLSWYKYHFPSSFAGLDTYTLRWPGKPGNCKCQIPTTTTTAAAHVNDVARFSESPYDKTITFQRERI